MKGVTHTMKRLLLVFFFCLQAFISSAALAWSPIDVFLDAYRSAVEASPQCYSLIASSEETEEEKKKKVGEEEEEEPDCD
jgi:hypothetical protein